VVLSIKSKPACYKETFFGSSWPFVGNDLSSTLVTSLVYVKSISRPARKMFTFMGKKSNLSLEVPGSIRHGIETAPRKIPQ